MRKPGRPTIRKNARKSRQIAIRVTDAEFKALQKEAKLAKIKLSELIRQKILTLVMS